MENLVNLKNKIRKAQPTFLKNWFGKEGLIKKGSKSFGFGMVLWKPIKNFGTLPKEWKIRRRMMP